MERITLEQATQGLIGQLEETLARLAIAADSNLSTYDHERKAKVLAGKIKAAATIFGDLPIYSGVEGIKLWSGDELPMDLYVRYASLTKATHEQLEIRKEDEKHYVKISEGVFIDLTDVPQPEIPRFKVKIEGNTLMAVSDKLFAKLPESAKNILTEGR